jgi:programmed cell death 6-interacting protein
MMELLSVPMKQTGDVDLVKPLKSVISSSRGPNTTDTNSLAELQTLRNRMVATIKNQEVSEDALESMQNYFDQIGNLELKIPFSKTKIYFKWLDAFDKGSWFGGSIPYTMSTNLLYEKACVLFNIAALSTQVGAAQNLSEEDGMKKAVKMFQLAAGIFSAVSTPPPSSSSEQKPTPDLSPESAAALASLCLAQAQEVVLQKAMADNKKDNIIAKLARHADTLYMETTNLMQKEAVKSLWEKSWVSTLSGKQAMFSGLVQLHQARVCKGEKSIGQEISRLQVARHLLTTSESLLPQGTCQKWIELCNIALEEAKKDNEFIYFEKVPAVEELAAVDGAAVVKATPLSDKFLSEQRDFFANMETLDTQAKKVECVVC